MAVRKLLERKCSRLRLRCRSGLQSIRDFRTLFFRWVSPLRVGQTGLSNAFGCFDLNHVDYNAAVPWSDQAPPHVDGTAKPSRRRCRLVATVRRILLGFVLSAIAMTMPFFAIS